jgi:bacteriorhodopsin
VSIIEEGTVTESQGDGGRRSGWLWLWVALFVALILALLLWAWPARRPPADRPADVSIVRVAAGVAMAPAGAA